MQQSTLLNQIQTDQFAAFIGVDWADEKHDVCLWTAEAGLDKHYELPQKPEAIQDWVSQLRQRFAGRKLAVCLEQARGALIHALLGSEFLVLFVINPKTLARFREAFTPSRAKGDPTDARYLCELVKAHHRQLRAWQPDDAATRALGRLNENRRRLVDQRTALSNQLRAELKSYYPQALDLVGAKVASPLACALLQRWPSLAQLKAVEPDRLRQFFREHKSHSKTIERRLNLIAQAAHLTQDQGIVAPGKMMVQAIVAQLVVLHRQIELMEKEIAHRFQAHPDYAIFSSLPGAAKAMGPRLLAAFGSDRSRFESAQCIQNLSGIAPITQASGKSSSVRFRQAAPVFLRQTFHEFARYSLSKSSWAHAALSALLRRGKSYQAAVRAIAFKWQRILWRMWQDRIAYDESKYLKVLQARGSQYAHITGG